MGIVFFGSRKLGANVLSHLIDIYETRPELYPSAVVVPERVIEHSDKVMEFVAAHGIPVIIHKKGYDNALYLALHQFEQYLYLMCSYDYKIPSFVINLPKYGFLNIHPGPLPQYRGPTPVQWQVHNKEKGIVVTMHRVTNGFDAGPVIGVESFPISKSTDKNLIMISAGYACNNLIDRYISFDGNDYIIPEGIPQDESKAKYYPRWKDIWWKKQT